MKSVNYLDVGDSPAVLDLVDPDPYVGRHADIVIRSGAGSLSVRYRTQEIARIQGVGHRVTLLALAARWIAIN